MGNSRNRDDREKIQARRDHKLWDYGRRCAGQILYQADIMRIHWIFWCICNYYYDFTTPPNSKCCSICYRLAAIWRGSFWDPNLRSQVVLRGRDLYQSKAHPRLPITSKYKVLPYLPSFGRNSNVKLCPPPQIDPPFGVRVDLRGRKKINRYAVYTFLFDFYTHYNPILHRLSPQYTPRQTDRRQTERYQQSLRDHKLGVGDAR